MMIFMLMKRPTTQGRLTAVAAAMVMEHEEVKEYFLGPRTYVSKNDEICI